VAGGGQERCTAPAAGGTRSVEQRAETQGGRRGKEWSRGPFCKSKEKQGLHCKELVTFKPVLKWRWPKKQKCVVSQTLQLLFKVHLQLSNNFEDTINLVIFSNFM
jgi:hypothetical protein